MKVKDRFQNYAQNAIRNTRAGWLLGILMAAFFVIQMVNINNAPWEKYDSWRQTDTYTIAQNYVQFNMNPLRPQFNYDGNGENYVQLELQVMPWISAVVYQLLGSEPFAVPRFISLVMFMISVVLVYKISEMFFSPGASLGAAAIYMFLPISVMYSRAIMPEAAALLFYTAAVYLFLKWYENSSTRALYSASIFTALAIMEKTPVIFIGIMFLVLFFKKEKLAAFKKPYMYGFGAISLGVPLVYYIYASSVATFHFVDNITEKHIFTSFFTAIFTPQARQFFLHEAPQFFGIIILGAAALGLVCCFAKKNFPLILWAGSMLLETITIVAIIRFGYYLVFLAPLVAVLCGALFNYIGKKNTAAGVIITMVCLAFAIFSMVKTAIPRINVDENITVVAQEIKRATKPDDIIATASVEPVLLGAANRRGYRANLKYYDYIPQEPQKELEYFIAHGVKYFVVQGEEIPNDDGEYIDILRENYSDVSSADVCEIFDLGAKK